MADETIPMKKASVGVGAKWNGGVAPFSSGLIQAGALGAARRRPRKELRKNERRASDFA